MNDFYVRFSLNNLSLDGKIVNIPLYFIEYIDNIRNKAEKLYGKKISRNGFDHLLWYYHKGQ